MKRFAFLFGTIILSMTSLNAQHWKSDSSWKRARKNTVRYNLSSALLFGIDKTFIFGYERVLSPHGSFSINGGSIVLPKIASITTDSFSLDEDLKNTGTNISADYRFYLAKENKYMAPHGIFIGPWYSYNSFKRQNSWDYKTSSSQKSATTDTKMSIHSVGIEMGYQFVFWDRVALDMVLIGPGMGFYKVNAKFDSNLTDAEKEQLKQALTDVLTEKFPGMDIVFDNKELDASGRLNVTSLGFRYIIHVGFRF
jgi:hypothetical protein